MRINVVGRQFEVTDAIRAHAEEKAHKLTRYDDLVQQIDIRVWKESDTREDYAAEIVVDVRSHGDFVSKAEGHDLYNTIDDAVTKADRQLHDHREKLKELNR
ncbi:MAG: ribosome-associated translation inhibitor RaiA [Phycisphaerales bacterium]|nr:ribosome-associated translation inhibitor RaiA [Phycisphaerales bacterium]